MDSQTAFNIVIGGFNVMIGLAAFLGGWILNNITKSIDRLDNDVRDMPSTYVSKVDYRNDLQDIKALLMKIDDKLDGKADK
ncbi:hypothetical protein [Novosphingobium mangrovi (ex Huang et al. 2023)]|uniref:TMhelix containing protein n=1 Tax=Novosphingobium mangrovi (ex Huang et al. 2023) TaxID=2976432 RepID=A0ABT2I155_9SPHN|nr:hypothetical protein [Novosphingobium mangrovi (ex Huang et al. 2023)]MCT2398539.1 hypothetical protein [Novosphingobium mangrovi (ex Huang et al. 2023)]